MAYEMVMPYHLHMPSYFLETFTEYPFPGGYHQHCFVSSRYPLITVLTSDLTLVFLWASAYITTLGSGDSTSWKKVSSKSFAF